MHEMRNEEDSSRQGKVACVTSVEALKPYPLFWSRSKHVCVVLWGCLKVADVFFGVARGENCFRDSPRASARSCFWILGCFWKVGKTAPFFVRKKGFYQRHRVKYRCFPSRIMSLLARISLRIMNFAYRCSCMG